MFTYILPCAGSGTRLGLPYPKELHRIKPGFSLIDFSLNHILQCTELTEKVVIVISPGKEIVAEYVERKLYNIADVQRVYFNNHYSEWPGSILSAEAHFGDANVALLPDSIITMQKNEMLASRYQQVLKNGADLAFAYVREKDRQRLSSLGALRVEGSRVSNFCDKPAIDHSGTFNAFWASFGFKKDAGRKVLQFMMNSVAKEPVNIESLEMDIGAFAVADYLDLGTWPSIAAHLDAKNLLN
jgi:UTP-glucose-1-phosphate uridylyltransferase